jgi:hypothetical protein
MSLALMTKRNTGHWWVATYKSLRILSAVQRSLGRTRQTLSYRQASTPTEERASWSLWHDGHSNWTKGLSPNVPYCAAADTSLDISSILRTRGSFVLLLVGRGVAQLRTSCPIPTTSHPPATKVFVMHISPFSTPSTSTESGRAIPIHSRAKVRRKDGVLLKSYIRY